MYSNLTSRLNQILPRITSKDFLLSKGIGNEIACYVFDYPPEAELQVRKHIEMMEQRIDSHYSRLKLLHLNLLNIVIAYLKKRTLLKKAIDMQATKGDAAVLRALNGPLAAEKISSFIDMEYRPADYDLFLLSGVGSAWPMIRAHSLLNCLHTIIEQTPLVMFYPGKFDGKTLRPLGISTNRISKPGAEPYYRAFSLVPRDSQV